MRLVAMIAVIAAVACKHSAHVVATLEQTHGPVERADPARAWSGAAVGDTFVLGDAVRTGPAATARLRFARGSVLDLAPDTIIELRARPGADEPDGIDVEAGAAELEAGSDGLQVGDGTLDPLTRARLTRTADGVTIDVQVGRLVLESGTAVGAGSQVALGSDGRARPDAGVAARDASPDATLPPPAAPTVAVTVSGKDASLRGTGALAPGAHAVPEGAHVDVPAGSTADVASGGAHAVVTGPAELVVGGPGALVTVTKGEVAIDGDAAPTTAAVPGGTVTARAGAKAIARVEPSGTDVQGRRGTTDVTAGDATESLQAGDAASLGHTGTIAVRSRAPAHASFAIVAGESAILHDPKAPTAVAVAFGAACTGEATLEIGKDRTFKLLLAQSGGRDRVNVLLAPGSHPYRLRCDAGGGKGTSGTLDVVRDAGRAPLPKTAPHTSIDADGREYAITYQNLLPELTLAWHGAPARASYVFVIQPATGAAKKVTAASPVTTLPSATLGEGAYRFWVEIPETGGRSPETRITIDFDNSAASASIEDVTAAGGKVHVKGTAIEASTVSSGGAAIALDRHRRFDVELAPVDGETGVAVRIAHPKLGVHYYVVAP